MRPEGRGGHWNTVYEQQGPAQRSWYQREPVVAAELIGTLDLPADAPIIDVGGGASTLVDVLLGAGYEDVTVLDISGAALETAQRRLGDASRRVTWLRRDLLQWEPDRRYDLWHDRAVFHFLVGPEERDLYRRVLAHALRSDAHAIVATFALNGPTHCSGLEVCRYSPEGICQELGGEFRLVAARAETHTTPGGMNQPFSWALMRRRPDGTGVIPPRASPPGRCHPSARSGRPPSARTSHPPRRRG